MSDYFIKVFNNKCLTERQKLKECENCNCCEIHQIDKPVVLKKWRETQPKRPKNEKMGNTIDTILNKNIRICDCPCRHYAREICRNVK